MTMHKVYADAFGIGAVDVHASDKAGYKIQASIEPLKQEFNQAMDISPSWLPIAAECYNISPNIKDYVMVAVVAVPSDIPNRNAVAFPLRELTKWNHECGCVAYQTWRGQPTFEEHNNKDHTKAKGVILSTTFRPLEGFKGNLWKVILLLAFDRTRDPILVNKILSGERDSYSMGAYASDYICSICGASANKGGCNHTNPYAPEFREYEGRLAYSKAINLKGFECSSVASPAWVAAQNKNVFTL